MAAPRLTMLVTFKRLKTDAPEDSAGQVNDSVASNWKAIGKRRGDVANVSSAESYSQNQPQTSDAWTVVCRGDELTTSITAEDQIEFAHKGKFVTLNISGIKTINNVPHYLEFSGSVN